MSHPHRLLLALLLFLPGLPGIAAREAGAAGLTYVENYTDPDFYNPHGLAISPDGRNLYAALYDDGIGVLAREPVTGGLSVLDLAWTGGGRESNTGPYAVTVSPDGSNVYEVGLDNVLTVFRRDPGTGTVTLLQAQHDGVGPVNGLNGAQSVVVSPDGTNLYVASNNDNAVAVFGRDTQTGLVTFIEMLRDGFGGSDGLGGAKGVSISPDGAYVYVAAAVDNAVGIFRRLPGTGELTFVEMVQNGVGGVDGIGGARFVTVTPDGADLLVAGGTDDAIAIFHRNPDLGTLTFVEAHRDGADGVNGLNGPRGIATSPDGTHVYVVGSVDDSLVVFDRDATTGALTFVERQRNGVAGVAGFNNPQAVVVSPDGANVYATGLASNSVVAFHQGVCGDGVVNPGEQCDDGNLVDDDCCSATCQATAAESPCDDRAFCTVNDVCQNGTCHGTARDCSAAASDQCHQGACDEATDACVPEPKTDGASCSDGNKCTLTDTCQAGVCVSGTPRVCVASDSCHDGVCNPATGRCSTPRKPEGSPCDDANACTRADTCVAGACVSGSPVTCAPLDQCHDAGVCSLATGTCTTPTSPDGSSCDDGASDTIHDICVGGLCRGIPPPDGDGDGVSDATDRCPIVPDPNQTDANHDGIGDACQCTSHAPGHCLAGGGSAATDCVLEFNPMRSAAAGGARRPLAPLVRCTDGDPACDLDGHADGQCTFGVAVCLGNTDPRYARCNPGKAIAFEVTAPQPEHARVPLDRTNALAIERIVSTMGVTIVRAGRPVGTGVGAHGLNACSAPIHLVVPAPAGGKPAVRRSFRTRALTADGRSDTDRLTLECR